MAFLLIRCNSIRCVVFVLFGNYVNGTVSALLIWRFNSLQIQLIFRANGLTFRYKLSWSRFSHRIKNTTTGSNWSTVSSARHWSKPHFSNNRISQLRTFSLDKIIMAGKKCVTARRMTRVGDYTFIHDPGSYHSQCYNTIKITYDKLWAEWNKCNRRARRDGARGANIIQQKYIL